MSHSLIETYSLSLSQTQQISHRETKLCLTLKSATNARTQKTEKVVLALDCNFKDITQKWGLIPLPWRM